MKNKIILLGLALLLFGLITSHRLEPELRVYPLAMGFQLSEQGYEVYYDMPDLSTYTGEGKPMDAGQRVWFFTGSDNQSIKNAILRSKKETPDMGHVQVILLGRSLLEHTQKYGEVLESFIRLPDLGSGAYVFVCDNVGSVMEAGSQKTDSLGRYLVDLIDKLPQKKQVILQDLYNAYYNQQHLPQMEEILLENEEIVLKDAAGIDLV